MRSYRPMLIVLLLLALPLVLAASPAGAGQAAADDGLFPVAADACSTSSAASPPAVFPSSETSQDGAQLFQDGTPPGLPDGALRLTSSSCPCPLSRVGKKCTCPDCGYIATCQLFAGNPICMTICADL